MCHLACCMPFVAVGCPKGPYLLIYFTCFVAAGQRKYLFVMAVVRLFASGGPGCLSAVPGVRLEFGGSFGPRDMFLYTVR